MKKVLFHGASVTQQSGEESYFFQLEKSLEHNVIDICIYKKGYGGNHLDDAGLLTIARDLEFGYDYCVLEWNTTSISVFDEKKILHIVEVILSKNTVPIFLILARRETVKSDRNCEQQVQSFCIEHNIPLLDCRPGLDPSIHLRDFVHTNLLGATFYASKIHSELLTKLNSFSTSSILNFEGVNHSGLIVRNFDFNQTLYEGQNLSVHLDGVVGKAEIIIEGVRGPSSPLIKCGCEVFSVWDQWSHYDRDSFINFSERISLYNGQYFFEILSDSPDYSKCVREFSYSGVKSLRIKSIFTVNCIISRLADSSTKCNFD